MGFPNAVFNSFECKKNTQLLFLSQKRAETYPNEAFLIIMEPIDYVRAKIKAAGVRTASLLSLLEARDKNRDGIVHFDDIDHILNGLMGKKEEDQLTRREMHVLRMSLSDASERGEVLYHRLYDVLENKKKDKGETEIWNETKDNRGIGNGFTRHVCRSSSSSGNSRRTLDGHSGTGAGTERVSMRGVQDRVAGSDNMPRASAASSNAYDYGGGMSVPRGSLEEYLQYRGADVGTAEQAANLERFMNALERYEAESGLRIVGTPNGLRVPIGPCLSVDVEFRGV